MIAGNIYRLQILGMSNHLASERAGHLLIRSDDFDAMKQFTLLVGTPASIRIARAITFETDFIGMHAMREFGHPIQIGSALVNVGIDGTHHNAIFPVRRQNCVLVPAVHIVVGMHPSRRHPTQDAHFDIRIVAARIGGELGARSTRHHRIIITVAHGRHVGTSRIVAVIAHFDFDGVHQRSLPAKQGLHHSPIRQFATGCSALLIQQQTGCSVTRQHAESFISQTITISCSSLHGFRAQTHLHHTGIYFTTHVFPSVFRVQNNVSS